MKSITIKGSKRESVGKVATKALRNAGKVPCVLYGGEKPLHFSADETEFKGLIYTPNVYTATIELESGEKCDAVLQDIQFHPVSDNINHVDFYQLFKDKEVTMNIPVKLVGNSIGVRAGGILRFPNRKLKVKALPANLPDVISVDITKLKLGEKIELAALRNKDYTILHPDNLIVAQVRMSRTAVAGAEGEAEEEEAAE
ncbi:MAG: 50S ribosomal protein L25/general stress protein Ctc [Flavobacteriaceae bacterium]|nr:50S ribosomal protein L25/general stress protein Ctc [Flavobacteriaceae bacterium]